MIILNLIVFNKVEIDHVVNNVLKNKWALTVIVGNEIDSYHMDKLAVINHSVVRTIQFVTKSLLFIEIETTLKKDFPGMDFIIYAAPAVHIDSANYEKIRNWIPGLTLLEKELLHP